jgi:hypothetical protein
VRGRKRTKRNGIILPQEKMPKPMPVTHAKCHMKIGKEEDGK